LLLITVLVTAPVLAQPASYQQQMADLKLEQQQLHTKLQTTTTALQRLQQQAEPKREKYLKAQREVIAATARHDENASDHNQSKLNNAEFKLALAEHKLNKFNGKIANLNLIVEQAQQQLQTIDQATAKLDKEEGRRQWLQKVASIEASLTTESPVALANPEPANEEPQPAAPSATTTAPPLTIATAADVTTPSPAPVAAAASAATELSLPEPVSPELASPEPTSLERPTTEPATPQPNERLEGKNGITFLRDRQQISDHQLSIEQLLATKGSQKSSRSRTMTIKPVTATSDDQSTAASKLRLTPLGNNIYRGVAAITSGDTVFIIGFNRWRQTIPASAHDDSEHVFIFNNSVRKKPQLVYYPQALESQP
jgi:hypothetical protein